MRAIPGFVVCCMLSFGAYAQQEQEAGTKEQPHQEPLPAGRINLLLPHSDGIKEFSSLPKATVSKGPSASAPVVRKVESIPRRHWYKDPKWWAGEAIIAAAIAADAHSTATRPHGTTESNFLLGSNPSNQKVALLSLLNFGIQTSLHASAWHVTHYVPIESSCEIDPQTEKTTYKCSEFTQDTLGWRITGYVGIPAAVAIINGHAAARNYQLK